MIEFRWVKTGLVEPITNQPEYKLQYRLLFAPHLIASGDIVLYAVVPHAKWTDVPHVNKDEST